MSTIDLIVILFSGVVGNNESRASDKASRVFLMRRSMVIDKPPFIK